MSTSALNTPAIDSRKPDPAPVNSDLRRCEGTGYRQWMMWLQSVLQAHSLILYRVETKDAQLQLQAVAGLPDVDSSGNSAYAQVAMRCAKSGSVVRAVSHERLTHSVVCLPDIARTNKLTRHVLLIERRDSTKLDAQTQTTMVSWAFKSLDKFLTQPATLPRENHLSQWALSRVNKTESLAAEFAQLMDQLIKLSSSERCLIASLRVQRNAVTGADLVAVSGQQYIDGQLPAAESLVSAVEETYGDKTLPLLTDKQALAEPSMAVQTPMATARKPCTRLIIPIACADRWYAVSLERAVDRPFSDAEQAYLERDLGLTLALLVLSDPQASTVTAVGKRQVICLYRQMATRAPRTVVVGSLCLSALLFLLLPAEYRVSAPLSVEASERHVLIAPVDGFVESVSVKAGDSVNKGQILGSLDDLDLQLQQQKLKSEVRQNQQAYAKALALHDRVEVTRLKEEASHMQTELSQLTLQRDRMKLVAPVSGVVLSGSWDDFLGAAVSSGDALFTLGSTNSHRLVLDVPEYDVRNVQPGQPVGIRMSADPANVLLGTVTAIMPLAVARDGANSVQVHAALDQPATLRPGMQGLGKILIGRQARLGQWFGRAMTRLIWLGWRIGVLK